MKKIITCIMIAALAMTCVFAALNPSVESELSGITDFDTGLTTRALGMGSAGIALPGRADSWRLNPAGQAGRNMFLLPAAQVNLYHVQDLLEKDDSGKNVIDKFMDQNDPEAMMSGATALLKSIKSGRGRIADVSADVGFDIMGFTLLGNIKDTIHTYGKGVGGLDAKLVNEATVTGVIGYAHEFNFGKYVDMSFGLNFRPTFTLYNSAIGAKEFLSMMSGDGQESADPMVMLQSIPIAAGAAYPIDLGFKFDFFDCLHLGVAARNINGTAYMHEYANVNDFRGEWQSAFTAKDFTVKTPWSLDAGISFDWKNSFFQPTISADIVDIVGLCKSELSARDWLNHLNVGAEIRLLSFLDVRAGMSSGWYSLGAGIDLWAIKLDLAYYVKEFGDTAGDYGLDAVSVRVNIGWDR